MTAIQSEVEVPTLSETGRSFAVSCKDYGGEAAGSALGGGQYGVFELDHIYDPNKPSYVPTSQFLHDQIAKGGSRCSGWAAAPNGRR
jgi:hypothetical protein